MSCCVSVHGVDVFCSIESDIDCCDEKCVGMLEKAMNAIGMINLERIESFIYH